MYLSIRDIRFARGRFALIGSVIALITLLIVMLTGLTHGLGKQNTSALDSLAPDRVVFAGGAPGEKPSIDFAESQIDASTAREWRHISGVQRVTALGAAQTRAELGGQATAVAVFGLPVGSQTPDGLTIKAGEAIIPEEIVEAEAVHAGSDAEASGGASRTKDAQASSTASEVANDRGNLIDLGGTKVPAGEETSTKYYSHLPVVWVDMDTWKTVSHLDKPTVLLVDGTPEKSAAAEVARRTGSQALPLTKAYQGLSAYQSERGSLLTMQGLLYGISALVIVAFLSVWTIQRTRDIAVLRALGASKRYVLTDALTQASIVVLAGAIGGGAVGAGLGAWVSGVVPFTLSWRTIAVPIIGVVALGIVAAVAATRKVAQIEPQIALGG
ncbi:hypothetical protein CATYP_00270 [Corynebacterium atypicum]|uniref:ABC3 transporter permease C-terminal domain-containing protein n=2 Tax=Corynebacterium atypicum TaxID=191610 RepID=A0ABN4DAR0_9CORY|nr:ABC transporter permease [Corynebacterium atypicum]AIG63399.1 hypothetical protein CATYP_00270 [Corynebacterium atypicum]